MGNTLDGAFTKDSQKTLELSIPCDQFEKVTDQQCQAEDPVVGQDQSCRLIDPSPTLEKTACPTLTDPTIVVTHVTFVEMSLWLQSDIESEASKKTTCNRMLVVPSGLNLYSHTTMGFEAVGQRMLSNETGMVGLQRGEWSNRTAFRLPGFAGGKAYQRAWLVIRTLAVG